MAWIIKCSCFWPWMRQKSKAPKADGVVLEHHGLPPLPEVVPIIEDEDEMDRLRKSTDANEQLIYAINAAWRKGGAVSGRVMDDGTLQLDGDTVE